jgi:hypothetical protein
LHKGLEDPLEVLRRDADPGVADTKVDVIAHYLLHDLDRSAVRRELDGVRGEIDQNLSELRRVRAHRERLLPWEIPIANSLRSGQRSNDALDRCHHRAEAHVLHPEYSDAGAELRVAQYRFNQTEQVPSIGLNALDV